jgi:hypothetical protein
MFLNFRPFYLCAADYSQSRFYRDFINPLASSYSVCSVAILFYESSPFLPITAVGFLFLVSLVDKLTKIFFYPPKISYRVVKAKGVAVEKAGSALLHIRLRRGPFPFLTH